MHKHFWARDIRVDGRFVLIVLSLVALAVFSR